MTCCGFRALLGLIIVLPLTSVGCVERVMKISTRPPGAIITVNDEEIGPSPAQFSFLWYGDYEIIIRKPGYETLKTHWRVQPPWYQVPPFDLFAEAFYPGTLRDVHELPPYELKPAERPSNEVLVERALETRAKTLFDAP